MNPLLPATNIAEKASTPALPSATISNQVRSESTLRSRGQSCEGNSNALLNNFLNLSGVAHAELDELSSLLARGPLTSDDIEHLVSVGFCGTPLAMPMAERLVEDALPHLIAPTADQDEIDAWKAVLVHALLLPPDRWQVELLPKRSILSAQIASSSGILQLLRDRLYCPLGLSQSTWSTWLAECRATVQDLDCSQLALDYQREWCATDRRVRLDEAMRLFTELCPGLPDEVQQKGWDAIRRLERKDRGLLEPRAGLPVVFDAQTNTAIIDDVYKRLEQMNGTANYRPPVGVRERSPAEHPQSGTPLSTLLFKVARNASTVRPEAIQRIGDYSTWSRTLTSLLYWPGGLSALRDNAGDISYALETAFDCFTGGPAHMASAVRAALQGLTNTSGWMQPSMHVTNAYASGSKLHPATASDEGHPTEVEATFYRRSGLSCIAETAAEHFLRRQELPRENFARAAPERSTEERQAVPNRPLDGDTDEASQYKPDGNAKQHTSSASSAEPFDRDAVAQAQVRSSTTAPAGLPSGLTKATHPINTRTFLNQFATTESVTNQFRATEDYLEGYYQRESRVLSASPAPRVPVTSLQELRNSVTMQGIPRSIPTAHIELSRIPSPKSTADIVDSDSNIRRDQGPVEAPVTVAGSYPAKVAATNAGISSRWLKQEQEPRATAGALTDEGYATHLSIEPTSFALPGAEAGVIRSAKDVGSHGAEEQDARVAEIEMTTAVENVAVTGLSSGEIIEALQTSADENGNTAWKLLSINERIDQAAVKDVLVRCMADEVVPLATQVKGVVEGDFATALDYLAAHVLQAVQAFQVLEPDQIEWMRQLQSHPRQVAFDEPTDWDVAWDIARDRNLSSDERNIVLQQLSEPNNAVPRTRREIRRNAFGASTRDFGSASRTNMETGMATALQTVPLSYKAPVAAIKTEDLAAQCAAEHLPATRHQTTLHPVSGDRTKKVIELHGVIDEINNGLGRRQLEIDRRCVADTRNLAELKRTVTDAADSMQAQQDVQRARIESARWIPEMRMGQDGAMHPVFKIKKKGDPPHAGKKYDRMAPKALEEDRKLKLMQSEFPQRFSDRKIGFTPSAGSMYALEIDAASQKLNRLIAHPDFCVLKAKHGLANDGYTLVSKHGDLIVSNGAGRTMNLKRDVAAGSQLGDIVRECVQATENIGIIRSNGEIQLGEVLHYYGHPLPTNPTQTAGLVSGMDGVSCNALPVNRDLIRDDDRLDLLLDVYAGSLLPYTLADVEKLKEIIDITTTPALKRQAQVLMNAVLDEVEATHATAAALLSAGEGRFMRLASIANVYGGLSAHVDHIANSEIPLGDNSILAPALVSYMILSDSDRHLREAFRLFTEERGLPQDFMSRLRYRRACSDWQELSRPLKSVFDQAAALQRGTSVDIPDAGLYTSPPVDTRGDYRIQHDALRHLQRLGHSETNLNRVYIPVSIYSPAFDYVAIVAEKLIEFKSDLQKGLHIDSQVSSQSKALNTPDRLREIDTTRPFQISLRWTTGHEARLDVTGQSSAQPGQKKSVHLSVLEVKAMARLSTSLSAIQATSAERLMVVRDDGKASLLTLLNYDGIDASEIATQQNISELIDALVPKASLIRGTDSNRAELPPFTMALKMDEPYTIKSHKSDEDNSSDYTLVTTRLKAMTTEVLEDYQKKISSTTHYGVTKDQVEREMLRALCSGGGMGLSMHLHDTDGEDDDYSEKHIANPQGARNIPEYLNDIAEELGSYIITKIRDVEAEGAINIRELELNLFVPNYDESRYELADRYIKAFDLRSQTPPFLFLDPLSREAQIVTQNMLARITHELKQADGMIDLAPSFIDAIARLLESDDPDWLNAEAAQRKSKVAAASKELQGIYYKWMSSNIDALQRLLIVQQPTQISFAAKAICNQLGLGEEHWGTIAARRVSVWYEAGLLNTGSFFPHDKLAQKTLLGIVYDETLRKEIGLASNKDQVIDSLTKALTDALPLAVNVEALRLRLEGIFSATYAVIATSVSNSGLSDAIVSPQTEFKRQNDLYINAASESYRTLEAQKILLRSPDVVRHVQEISSASHSDGGPVDYVSLLDKVQLDDLNQKVEAFVTALKVQRNTDDLSPLASSAQQMFEQAKDFAMQICRNAPLEICMAINVLDDLIEGADEKAIEMDALFLFSAKISSLKLRGAKSVGALMQVSANAWALQTALQQYREAVDRKDYEAMNQSLSGLLMSANGLFESGAASSIAVNERIYAHLEKMNLAKSRSAGDEEVGNQQGSGSEAAALGISQADDIKWHIGDSGRMFERRINKGIFTALWNGDVVIENGARAVRLGDARDAVYMLNGIAYRPIETPHGTQELAPVHALNINDGSWTKSGDNGRTVFEHGSAGGDFPKDFRGAVDNSRTSSNNAASWFRRQASEFDTLSVDVLDAFGNKIDTKSISIGVIEHKYVIAQEGVEVLEHAGIQDGKTRFLRGDGSAVVVAGELSPIPAYKDRIAARIVGSRGMFVTVEITGTVHGLENTKTVAGVLATEKNGAAQVLILGADAGVHYRGVVPAEHSLILAPGEHLPEQQPINVVMNRIDPKADPKLASPELWRKNHEYRDTAAEDDFSLELLYGALAANDAFSKNPEWVQEMVTAIRSMKEQFPASIRDTFNPYYALNTIEELAILFAPRNQAALPEAILGRSLRWGGMSEPHDVDFIQSMLRKCMYDGKPLLGEHELVSSDSSRQERLRERILELTSGNNLLFAEVILKDGGIKIYSVLGSESGVSLAQGNPDIATGSELIIDQIERYHPDPSKVKEIHLSSLNRIADDDARRIFTSLQRGYNYEVVVSLEKSPNGNYADRGLTREVKIPSDGYSILEMKENRIGLAQLKQLEIALAEDPTPDTLHTLGDKVIVGEGTSVSFPEALDDTQTMIVNGIKYTQVIENGHVVYKRDSAEDTVELGCSRSRRAIEARCGSGGQYIVSKSITKGADLPALGTDTADERAWTPWVSDIQVKGVKITEPLPAQPEGHHPQSKKAPPKPKEYVVAPYENKYMLLNDNKVSSIPKSVLKKLPILENGPRYMTEIEATLLYRHGEGAAISAPQIDANLPGSEIKFGASIFKQKDMDIEWIVAQYDGNWYSASFPRTKGESTPRSFKMTKMNGLAELTPMEMQLQRQHAGMQAINYHAKTLEVAEVERILDVNQKLGLGSTDIMPNPYFDTDTSAAQAYLADKETRLNVQLKERANDAWAWEALSSEGNPKIQEAKAEFVDISKAIFPTENIDNIEDLMALSSNKNSIIGAKNFLIYIANGEHIYFSISGQTPPPSFFETGSTQNIRVGERSLTITHVDSDPKLQEYIDRLNVDGEYPPPLPTTGTAHELGLSLSDFRMDVSRAQDTERKVIAYLAYSDKVPPTPITSIKVYNRNDACKSCAALLQQHFKRMTSVIHIYGNEYTKY